MSAASAVCCLVVVAATGWDSSGAALLGLAGPLAAAVATWIIVERQHARMPGRTPGVMIKLFAAKVLFFGAYVAAIVLLVPEWAMVFVVSFTSQYILLHALEAVFLRRLFSSAAEPRVS
jgi:hypothetical protein